MNSKAFIQTILFIHTLYEDECWDQYYHWASYLVVVQEPTPDHPHHSLYCQLVLENINYQIIQFEDFSPNCLLIYWKKKNFPSDFISHPWVLGHGDYDGSAVSNGLSRGVRGVRLYYRIILLLHLTFHSVYMYARTSYIVVSNKICQEGIKKLQFQSHICFK